MDQALSAPIDDRLDGQLDAKRDAQMDAKLDGTLDGQMDGQLDAQLDARLDAPAGGKLDAGMGAPAAATQPGGGPQAPASDGGSGGEAAIDRPEPETGGHHLAQPALSFRPPALAFSAPTELAVKSDKAPADGDAKNPDVIRHRAAFAEAAQVAARLHAVIARDAQSIANASANAASARLDRTQAALDRGLAGLETALHAARAGLASDAQAALSLLHAKRTAARAFIRATATSAAATLVADAGTMQRKYDAVEPKPDGIVTAAQAQLDQLVADGDKAVTAIDTLGNSPAAAFPYSGARLPDARTEAVIDGMPARAPKRSTWFSGEKSVHTTFLEGPIKAMPAAITEATASFKQLIDKTKTAGPAAVRKARDGAWKQLDAAEARIQTAIERSRDLNDAILIRQHNEARTRMIEAAEAAAKGDAQAALARAESDKSRTISAARGQAGAVANLHDGFKREAQRPAAEFAGVVARGSKAMADRLALSAPEQTAKLSRSAADGRTAVDRSSNATIGRLDASAEASAEALRALAREAGGRLIPQAREGSANFRSMADPVGKTMDQYRVPFDKAFQEKIDKMRLALEAARDSFQNAYNTGKGGGKEGDGKGGGGKAAAQPKKPSKDYQADSAKVAADAKKDELIAEFITKAGKAVEDSVRSRTNKLRLELGKYSVDVEPVMAALRGLTPKSGPAVSEAYGEAALLAAIEDKLRKYFSTGGTDDANVNAAKAHLAGDEAAAGLEELKAAVNWINDDARVETVQRGMSPADLAKLNAMGKAGEMDAIEGDLDGNNARVFALLRKGDETSVAEANAIRGKEAIDKAREERGDKGGDATFQAMVDAAGKAGNDRLSGKENYDIGDTLGQELAAERNAKAWSATLTQFDKLEPIPDTEKEKVLGADGKPYSGPGAAMYRYATKARSYTEEDYDPDSRSRTRRTVQESLTRDQSLRLEKLLVHGANSPEVAAATLLIETKRAGGKVDKDKLDAALHDKSLDAREGEKLTKEERARREAEAQKRFDKIFEKFGEYAGDTRKPQEIRDSLIEKIGASYADENEKTYVQSILRSPGGDPVAAANFAIEGAGTNTDLLKKMLKRMNREQADKFVADYDKAHPNDPLYKRLGVYGEGDWSLGAIVTGNFPETSGDDKNDLEILLMGTPTTDRERAEVARLTAKQQIDQAGPLGRLLAEDEYHNLVATADRLRERMGFSPEEYGQAFDNRGRFRVTNPVTGEPTPLGNFNADGDFQPKNKDSARLFEDAMGMATMSAESYKQSVDRVATYVTTTLVVTAAIITTALTFGAGASIWIPVLVTAGAGLLGMGASALIKGGRYGYDDISRDLAMTVIQAATAGAGAAAGAAMRGGMPALKVASGAFKVSEKALEAAAGAGKVAFSKSLTLAQEIALGAGSGAFAGGANALLDDKAWHEGRFGTNILHGMLRGGLGGGAGAGASRLGAGAIGRVAAGGRGALKLPPLPKDAPPHWALGLTSRVAGSGTAGFGQSVTEAGYSTIVQGKKITTEQMLRDAGWAALQNAAQSVGEGAIEQRGMAKQNALHAANDNQPGPHPTNVDTDGDTTAPLTRPVATTDDPGTQPHVKAAVDDDDAAITQPRMKAVSPDDDDAAITQPRMKAVSPDDDDAAITQTRMQALSPDDDDAAITQTRMKAVSPDDDDAAITQTRMKSVKDDDTDTGGAKAKAKPDADDPFSGVQQPEPDWIREQKHLTPGSVVIDSDPTNPVKALDDYRARLRESPDREVGIYRNTETGHLIVVQGDAMNVFVDLQKVKGKPGEVKKFGPAGAGGKQGWKQVLLGQDVGDWELVIHFHPADHGADAAGLPVRMPSGKGADMSIVEAESIRAGGTPRKSRIEYMEGNGQLGHTDFGYDPGLPGGPYWVDHADPMGGGRTKTPFATIEAYHDYFEFVTGQKLLAAGDAPTPAPTASPAAAHRPDDYVFHHGTSKEGLASIQQQGIIAQRKSGAIHDFGAGFYVTPQEDVAGLYAHNRSGPEGQRKEGAVLSFRVPKDAMGVVVDIRPNGEFGAQWQAFLDSPSPFAEGVARKIYPPDMPTKMGEYLDSYGREQKGAAIDRFLQSIDRSNADAIFGDLGGRATAGIGSGRDGAEQLVVRTQRLADILTQQVPGRTTDGAPAPAAAPRLGDTSAATVVPKPDEPAPASPRPATAEAAEAERSSRPRVDPDIDALVETMFGPDGPKPVVDPANVVPPSAERAAAVKANAEARSAERRRVYGMEPEVMEAHLSKLDAGTTTIDATVDAFRKARLARNPDAAAAAADAKALRAVLEHTKAQKQAEFVALQTALAPVVDAMKIGPGLKAFVMNSPVLLAVVHKNPELAEKRLRRMAGRYRGKNFNQARFEEGWDSYYTANQLPQTSEMDAMFRLGERGIDIIKGGGKANKHGIDIIAIEQVPARDGAPAKARIHLIDDKAVDAELLSSVTALTQHLEKNLTRDAAAFQKVLDQHKADGHAIDPTHAAAAKNLADAATDLKALKAKYGGGDAVWQNPDYAKAVQKMLKDRGIEMWITAAHGKVERVSSLLGKEGYGFQVMFNKDRDLVPPPPAPPPPP